MKSEFTNDELTIHFQQLQQNLKISRLPDGKAGYREAKPDEFMLMHEHDGRVSFKHRNTREYVSQSLLGQGFTVHGNNYDGGVYELSDEEFQALIDAASKAA